MEFPMYVVNRGIFVAEDGTEHETYGISCVLNGQILKEINNISTSHRLVLNMACLFTKCGLCLNRFKPVLEVLISLDSDTLEEIGMYDEVC